MHGDDRSQPDRRFVADDDPLVFVKQLHARHSTPGSGIDLHMQSEPQTNSSAVVSAGACGVAVVLAVVGLALSGSGRQVAEVAAVLAAIFGFGLGFSGFTVARLGAPRMGLALAAMIGNLVVMVAAGLLFFT